MWMLPLYLHVDQTSDYDDDDIVCHSIEDLKKQFCKEQNLGKKSMEKCSKFYNIYRKVSFREYWFFVPFIPQLTTSTSCYAIIMQPSKVQINLCIPASDQINLCSLTYSIYSTLSIDFERTC